MTPLQQLELVANAWDPEEPTRKQISSGSYAAVFDSDQPNMVIKRVKKTMKDAYILYALYAMEFHTKHTILPKISAAVLDKDGSSFFMMERLYYYESNDKRPCIVGNIDEGGFFYVQHQILNNSKLTPNDKMAIMMMLTEMHLWFTYDKENFPFFFDAHSENWMFRVNNLVLIDPFTYRKGLTTEPSFITSVQKLIIDRASVLKNVKLVNF